MPELPTTAVGMGVIILLVALAVPAAITTIETDQTRTYDMGPGETETVTQQLQVTVTDTTTSSATVRLNDAETVQEETQTVNESETVQYSLNGETVNVTVIEAQGNNQNTIVSVEYPRTYGWDDGAVTLVDNLPFVLAVLGFVVIVGTIGAVLRNY